MQESITLIKSVDMYLIDQELRKVSEEMAADCGYDPERIVLEGNTASPSDLAYSLDSSGLFASARLVFWKNPDCLTKDARKASGGDEEYMAVLQDFAAYGQGECQLIIGWLQAEGAAQGKASKGRSDKKQARAASVAGWLETNARMVVKGRPTVQELKHWLRLELVERGQEYEDAFVDRLAESGQDMYHMITLLDKLCLLAGNQRLAARMLEEELEIKHETSIFKLMDALSARQTGPALRALDELLEQGEAPLKIFFMMARDMKVLARIKSLQEQGMSTSDIERMSGQKPFTVKKMMSKTALFSWPDIERMFGLLLETDIAMKNTSKNERLLLEMLIAEYGRPQ